jgi:hypothetical protein
MILPRWQEASLLAAPFTASPVNAKRQALESSGNLDGW